MEMTTDEIVRSFREAKDRRKQVTILAELNDCSVEEIRSTLVAGGISWRELPRAPRAGKAPNVATTEDPSESRKSPPPNRDRSGNRRRVRDGDADHQRSAYRLLSDVTREICAGGCKTPRQNGYNVFKNTQYRASA